MLLLFMTYPIYSGFLLGPFRNVCFLYPVQTGLFNLKQNPPWSNRQ